jgi:CDGSH-type Zn-finger protein
MAEETKAAVEDLSIATFTCCEDGSDCPCYTSEVARPPPAILKTKTKSLKLQMEAGKTYSLCSCGQSKNFPYCDGSHRAYNAANGTSFKSFKVTPEEDKIVGICQCGHSQNRPFCDGSHRKLVESTGAPAATVVPLTATIPAAAAPAAAAAVKKSSDEESVSFFARPITVVAAEGVVDSVASMLDGAKGQAPQAVRKQVCVCVWGLGFGGRGG